MRIQLQLGQYTDPSSIFVSGEHEGHHLMDLSVHPYGSSLYSTEKGFVIGPAPSPEDLFRRYGDVHQGTPYHSTDAAADILTVVKYDRDFLGDGWVNTNGELLAEGVYDACFTQSSGQPGSLIRERAIALRREHEGKESPPDPLYTDLQSFFALHHRSLPWLTSPKSLPVEFSGTQESRMKVVKWYRYQLQKAEDAGILGRGLDSPSFFGGRPKGPVGTDVMLDYDSFALLYDSSEAGQAGQD